MARKAEPGIMYYPRDVDMVHHKKIKLLFQEFDSHGPWVFDCLLSEIYKNKGYFLDTNDKDYIMLFATDVCKKPMTLVNAIIMGCVRRELFSSVVFDATKILTSDRIQETYIEATAERRRKGTEIVLRSELMLIAVDERWQNIVVTGNNSILPRKKEIIPRKNPQSKVEEKKVEESRGRVLRAREDILKFLFEYLEKNKRKFFPIECAKCESEILKLQDAKKWTKELDEKIFEKHIGSALKKEIEKMWNWYAKKGKQDTIVDWGAAMSDWLAKRDDFKTKRS